MTTETKTKTKPILCQTEMVRAILNGTKTQTRRTQGLEIINENPDKWNLENMDFGENIDKFLRSLVLFERNDGQRKLIKKPYESIMWVRETYCIEKRKYKRRVYKAGDESGNVFPVEKWKEQGLIKEEHIK